MDACRPERLSRYQRGLGCAGGLKLRLDISAQLGATLGDRLDPRDLLELVAAEAASAETRRTVERAESRQQALALLLMSPEFQRR